MKKLQYLNLATLVPLLWVTGITYPSFAQTEASTATLLGPLPYLEVADSPFAADISAGSVVLEDFEDNLLDVPGVTASAGNPYGPSDITDSVDADDGSIDGSGTDGHSFFYDPGDPGITFTFDKPFPTKAGIVWTDGFDPIIFEAFDEDNLSLGTLTGNHDDDDIHGGTDEDRFYGVVNPTGVSRIVISCNASGGIEVDHLQFGAPVLTLTGAASRKKHGSAGDFDLPLVLSPAANSTVEPRVDGPTNIIYTFNRDVAAADGDFNCTECTVINAVCLNVVSSGNRLKVQLRSVIDQSIVHVTLHGITDLVGTPLSGDNDVAIVALVGDISQNRSVYSRDENIVTTHWGETVNMGNYLADLNLGGTIGLADSMIVESNWGHTVP
jgi:hypothetical protein